MNRKNNILYELQNRLIFARQHDAKLPIAPITVDEYKVNKKKNFDDFIPQFARKLHIQYHYIINIQTKGIKVDLYSDTKISKNKLEIIKTYLNFFYLNYNAFVIKRTFYIVLNKNKRRFEYNIKGYIIKENVNGGATYKLNNRKHDIYIYREEEFERLLVHELIHTFELDQFLFDKDIHFFKELFGKDILDINDVDIIDIKPYLFEIFTQTFAIILISIRYNIDKSKPIQNTSGRMDIKKIYKYIKDNCNHLLKICKKIQNKTKELGFYKEETSILSYYFGVCILLCDIDIFFNFLNKYNAKLFNQKHFINDFKDVLIKNKKKFVKQLNKTELLPNYNTMILSIFE